VTLTPRPHHDRRRQHVGVERDPTRIVRDHERLGIVDRRLEGTSDLREGHPAGHGHVALGERRQGAERQAQAWAAHLERDAADPESLPRRRRGEQALQAAVRPRAQRGVAPEPRRRLAQHLAGHVAPWTGTPGGWPSRRTASASRAESARNPWSTWSAWSRRLHAGASAASECRSATESAPPDTATKTHSPPASIAWRRMVRSTRSSTVTRLSALETDPDLAVLEVLLLPDGHRPLERVDRVPARLERLRAVRRRHGDEHARLTDLEPADAVEHRHPPHPGPARADSLADLTHLRLRHRRMRLVLEELHGPPLRL